jgi:hypothetical protein
MFDLIWATGQVHNFRPTSSQLAVEGLGRGRPLVTTDLQAASISRDGSRIVTECSDKSAKIWDATPISREFLPREFTHRRGR